MGIMPGITGTVTPSMDELDIARKWRWRQTFFLDFLQPLKKSVHVVEELGDNEICPCIDLFLQKCELGVIVIE